MKSKNTFNKINKDLHTKYNKIIIYQLLKILKNLEY